MMKKTFATILSLAVIASIVNVNSVKAAQSKDLRMIPVIVNGQKVKFPDTEPYIDGNGRTLVPVRFVSEKLGAIVVWNDADTSVTIKYGTKEINLPLDSTTVTVDGKAVSLDTSAVLTEGRTMVPLRFVSEALSSEVVWDEGGHAVKVTDESYKTKVTNGSEVLDAWGREKSKTWDAKWNRLTDLPESFYNFTTPQGLTTDRNNKDVWDFGYNKEVLTKSNIDLWGNHIRKYYEAQLNVDYRTIDEDIFTTALTTEMEFPSPYHKSVIVKAIKGYVAWVKSNHVIARGYADPENSMVRTENGLFDVRTHFKFMIISADDTTQTFMDNYDPSETSESPYLKTGVWYEGYSNVLMFTNNASYYGEHAAIGGCENMFKKGRYTYIEIQE